MGTNYFNKDTPKLVLRSLFQKYDTTGAGSLSIEQLNKLLVEDLCLPPDVVETVLYLGDDDGHVGMLTFKEFKKFIKSGDAGLTLVMDQARSHKLHDAIEMFKKYDTDKSASLSSTELKAMLEALGQPDFDAESGFQYFDNDKDGIVNFPDFLNWLHWV